ncbi:hypothetical protein B0H10DRAFT_1950664 [Mycena sp. CBHHK59/15]|nr:hypothetical protein B0H10DRAFT_1950664 [Mycena sp. CBHHK59/15]
MGSGVTRSLSADHREGDVVLRLSGSASTMDTSPERTEANSVGEGNELRAISRIDTTTIMATLTEGGSMVWYNSLCKNPADNAIAQQEETRVSRRLSLLDRASYLTGGDVSGMEEGRKNEDDRALSVLESASEDDALVFGTQKMGLKNLDEAEEIQGEVVHSSQSEQL